MTRVRLNREILEDRVIAIARRVPRDRLTDVAGILVDCGIRSVEVTLDSDDALAAIVRSREASFGQSTTDPRQD